MNKRSGSPIKIEWFTASLSSNTLNGGTVIPILFIPESVEESFDVNMATENIIGFSSPIIAYSNTGARRISYSFTVLDDMMPYKTDGTQWNIVSYTNAIKALEYPNYNSTGVIEAPECRLKLGQIDAYGVITSVGLSWSRPTDAIAGGVYSTCTVTISFTEVRNAAVGAIEIMNGE